MKAEAYAAFKVGVFGTILVGLCAMTLGLLGGLLSLDPVIYFASMAGVMVPMVMVVAGALALWASHNPVLFPDRCRGGYRKAAATSLTAGVTIVAGAAIMFLLVLPPGGVRTLFVGLDAYGYAVVAVLLAAYVALAVIGGALYRIVVPEKPAR